MWGDIVAEVFTVEIEAAGKQGAGAPAAAAAAPATAAAPPPRIKCIAVDLDNTLWPGILVENQGADVRRTLEHVVLDTTRFFFVFFIDERFDDQFVVFDFFYYLGRPHDR